MPTWRQVPGPVSNGSFSVTSWGGRTDVFTTGPNNSVYHTWRNTDTGNNKWSLWEELGGQVDGKISAVSWGPSRIDLFYKGFDSACYHKKSSDGTNWSDWSSVGNKGTVNSEISAVSSGSNSIDLFARGMASELLHMRWNGTEWSGWETLGTPYQGAPRAVSRTKGCVDVVMRGITNQVWMQSFYGGIWHDPVYLGESAMDDPAVVTWGSNALYVYTRAADGSMKRITMDGTTLSQAWIQVANPRTLCSPIVAKGWGTSNIAVAFTGNNGFTWTNIWYDSKNSWTGWTNISGTATGSPAILPVGGGEPPILFTRGPDGLMWTYE